MVHEFDPVTEVEFPSPSVATESVSNQPAFDKLAALQFLWEKRQSLFRIAVWALAISTVVAFLIPNEYESSVSIMPPDSMNGSGAMLAALSAKASPELATLAGSLLGTKSSSALFVALLRSRSVQDRVVDRLNLQKVYWVRYKQDARKKLYSRTDVSVERKSDVITLTVTDRSPATGPRHCTGICGRVEPHCVPGEHFCGPTGTRIHRTTSHRGKERARGC